MDLASGLSLLAIFVNTCESLECYDCIEGIGGVQDCDQIIDCPEGMDVCTLEWDGKQISLLILILSRSLLLTGLPTNILNKGCGHSAIRNCPGPMCSPPDNCDGMEEKQYG